MDLLDLKNISEFNGNFNFLVLFVDFFSKYLTVIPIKNKSKESILFALKTFFEKKITIAILAYTQIWRVVFTVI